ncbi:MAG: O-antigen ligase family protein [Acidimicrobiales bacterium]
MIRRIVPQFSTIAIAAAAGFALVAGYQLGGGSVPFVPAFSDELILAGAAGLLGAGAMATLLARPQLIGRIAPTIYVIVAFLPLLRFAIPGISFIRFIPLALVAPAAYSLYRRSEPIESHARVARVAMFAAGAAAVLSIVANRSGTDEMRLLLMVGGILLLVGAAPRAWAENWQESVEKAVARTFWLLVILSITFVPFTDSFISDRYRGAFSSPNAFGILVAIATPIAANRSRFAVVYWAISFVMVISSGSRGALLSLSVALVVLLVRHRRFAQLAAAAAVVLLVLATGVVRTQATHEQTFGVNTRELIWTEVFDASLDAPLVGHGFGAADGFPFSAETQRWAGVSPQTHSSWLDAFYEQGAPGLAIFGLALGMGLLAAHRAGPVWVATLVAGLVSATFESWLFAIGGGIGSLFWLVFGAATLPSAVTPPRSIPLAMALESAESLAPEKRRTRFTVDAVDRFRARSGSGRRGGS